MVVFQYQLRGYCDALRAPSHPLAWGTGEAFFWLPDARRIPGWVLAAPARTLIHWFLSRHGIHLVHGAAIGDRGGAVLITARGGSGKSTTALSCVAAGMGFLSDDYTAVSLGERPTVHSIYNAAKLTPHSLAAFPELDGHVASRPAGDNDKAVLYVGAFAPRQIVHEAPLRAILVPVLHATQTTHVTEASRSEAFLALMPSTVFQLALPDTAKVAALRQIVERVPCRRLMLGPDMRAVAGGIAAFLSEGIAA